MSNDVDFKDIDLGRAGDMTVDKFIRQVVANMFQMDNDVAVLHTRLDNENSPSPVVTLELRVKEIYLDKEDDDNE